MSDPIRPDKLLAQSRVLAGFDAGRGRPSTIGNRRAVSGAYYALFHELVKQSIDASLPGASREDAYKLARWYNHADLKAVCSWIAACAAVVDPIPDRPPRLPDNGVWALFSSPAGAGLRAPDVPAPLSFIADAYLSLIDARHDADYNHESTFPRATAQAHVRAAELAIERLRANTADAHVRKFLVLLLARASGLKG